MEHGRYFLFNNLYDPLFIFLLKYSTFVGLTYGLIVRYDVATFLSHRYLETSDPVIQC